MRTDRPALRGRWVALLGIFIMLFCMRPARAGQDAEKESLKARLEQLERRLEELEQQQPNDRQASGVPAVDSKTVDVEELRRQLEVLAEEVEKLRSGEEPVEVTPQKAQSLGLSPSAASVYRKRQGVSIAGYGEMLYENFDSENEAGIDVDRGSRLDFLRAILYTGYRFNDKFLFNSEIEIEHANEASVEFAYLDYLLNENLAIRGGMLLLPMGLVNEFHEPNVFLGARRPETETRIIPSTWRENGFGLVGSYEKVNFRAYLVNGLNAAGFTSAGLRGGRQKGSQARASDLAIVGRLDLAPTPGVFFGGSVYCGGSDQEQFVFEGRRLHVQTTIAEAHAQVQLRGFDLRGLFARATLDDVAGLNAARSLSGRAGIGKTLQGGYLQLGYNVLSQIDERIGLTPYYRFESVDTQQETASGFPADPAQDGIFHTLGLEFRPIYNIVIKSDYQWLRNEASSGLNQFNIAMGYSF